jgi:hypothetical protein
MRQAIAYFREALRLQPDWAVAHRVTPAFATALLREHH